MVCSGNISEPAVGTAPAEVGVHIVQAHEVDGLGGSQDAAAGRESQRADGAHRAAKQVEASVEHAHVPHARCRILQQGSTMHVSMTQSVPPPELESSHWVASCVPRAYHGCMPQHVCAAQASQQRAVGHPPVLLPAGGGANLVACSQQRPRGVPGHRKAVVQMPAQRGHLQPRARVQHHCVRVIAHHRKRGAPRLHACIVDRPGEAVPAAHREAVIMALEAAPCLAGRQAHSVLPQTPPALRYQIRRFKASLTNSNNIQQLNRWRGESASRHAPVVHSLRNMQNSQRDQG